MLRSKAPAAYTIRLGYLRGARQRAHTHHHLAYTCHCGIRLEIPITGCLPSRNNLDWKLGSALNLKKAGGVGRGGVGERHDFFLKKGGTEKKSLR